MAEEYKEYRRRREKQTKTHSKARSILKKFLRQSAISLIIFTLVLGLKTMDHHNTGTINKFLHTAMTKPMNTDYLQGLLNKFMHISQTTKEGRKNEAITTTADKTY